MAPSWASYDTWNVGVATLERPLARVEDLLPLPTVRWLPPRPPLFYIADPFPYRLDGREWLLVEDYGHPKSVRGRISRIDLQNPAGALEPAIVRDRHVSYPYTFADGGQIYCAPEMNREGGCTLYALDADGGWQVRHHILPGVRLVDPTFFRVDGLWWLLATEPPPLHTSVLKAFYAPAIDGPWTAHARNPLKRDAATARPAGRPFAVGDRLYRPAQDCSATYGGAVHVLSIDTLTPTSFAETLALRLEPDPTWPYPDGLHHLVVDGTRVFIDAKRTTVDWLLPLRVRLKPSAHGSG